MHWQRYWWQLLIWLPCYSALVSLYLVSTGCKLIGRHPCVCCLIKTKPLAEVLSGAGTARLLTDT